MRRTRLATVTAVVVTAVVVTVWAAVVAPACGSSSAGGGKVTLIEEEAPEPDDFVIARATYNRVIELGPSWFIQQVRLQPHLVGGRFRGFMLLALFPEYPEFESSVLHAGDIIQKVNGMSVERPGQFMEVWKTLPARDQLTLRVLRENRPIKLTWVIR